MKEKAEQTQTTQEQIIQTILAIDHPERMKHSLEQMFRAFFILDEEHEPETRQNVYMTYQVLRDALTDLETFEKQLQRTTDNVQAQ